MAKKPTEPITIVATFISPGVSKGAAGWMIVGGKLKKIPPRGPAFAQLTEAVQKMAGGR